MRNERYCGDVLTRKRFTKFAADVHDQKSFKNRGEKPQSHYRDDHEAIIDRNDFLAVQRIMNNARFGGTSLLPELQVIPDGLLKGFVIVHVFVIAHAYKHYSRSGTGIRTLADIYIMNQKLGGTLNWEYVDSELRGLGIFSYEHESRELAQKIFGIAELPTKANLSEAEQQMLAYYLGASTYGTIENRILNQMQKLQPDDGAFTARTKRKYLLSRIFPGREWCEAYAPTVYKYPVLLPFFWVWRLIYKGITNRKKVTQEIKTIKAGKQN